MIMVVRSIGRFYQVPLIPAILVVAYPVAEDLDLGIAGVAKSGECVHVRYLHRTS